MSGVQITGYNRLGFPVLVTRPTYEEAWAEVQAAQLLARQPEDQAIEEVVVVACVYKEYYGNGGNLIQVVDCYPEFLGTSEWGTMRVANFYFNGPEDFAQFEAQSGLKVSQMPKRDEKTVITRVQGRPHKHEVACKTPFAILRIQDGVYEEGHPMAGKKKWNYAYANPKQVTVEQSAPPTAQQRIPEPPPSEDKPQPPNFNIEFLADKIKEHTDANLLLIMDWLGTTPTLFVQNHSLAQARDIIIKTLVDQNRYFYTSSVERKTDGKKKWLVLDFGFFSLTQWTRQPFIDAGIIGEKDWAENRKYEIEPAAQILLKVKGEGYEVESVAAGSPEGDYPF